MSESAVGWLMLGSGFLLSVNAQIGLATGIARFGIGTHERDSEPFFYWGAIALGIALGPFSIFMGLKMLLF